MEWSNNNRYNSFNSYKGLTYYQHYQSILDWMHGDDYLPAPIEINLDPIAECNLKCYFCNVQRYLRNNREDAGEIRWLPTGYMLKLVDFLAQWGVRGLCISGGGEPSLHQGIYNVINHAVSKGLDVSFVTNAVALPDNLVRALMQCRWVSLSVDSADRATYALIKSGPHFDKVTANIQRLTRLRMNTNSKVDFCFKFLIMPENVHQIYEACKLARELGVQDFHARPADLEKPDVGASLPAYNMALIQEQFEMCHELEDSLFHVYTVTHKFDDDFHVKHDFDKCLATPLILPVLSNGNSYICVDRKMDSRVFLGSAYPEPEQILDWWGSDVHRELIKSINIDECSRCIYSQYHNQIQKVVTEDKMCVSFP